MSKHSTTADRTVAQEPTPWKHLADTEPIEIRDPLAEVLGMVPDGEPLVLTFADIVKAAGHACPAVAGAYRGTQLGLEQLYPDSLPVRSDIGVTVGGEPDTPGIGPMANVVRHITGAADETGFNGFGGFGGREDLLSFGSIDAPGRAFRFERNDTGDAVVVSFDPSSTGINPDTGGGTPLQPISKVVSGEADDETTEKFRKQWHERVQRILDAPEENGPFAVERIE